MSWISELFTNSASALVESIGDAIDKNVTTDEERLKLKNELVSLQMTQLQKAQELEADFEKEVSKRWVSDNEHTITRLVRPVSFSIMMFVFIVIVLGDGNFGGVPVDVFDANGTVVGIKSVGGFTVRESYLPILESIMTTMIFAYFGSRGVEKSVKAWKGKIS
jgi:hypothetical protein